MKVTHCCADCGEVMAVHEHSSWQEIKECDRKQRPLCDACRCWTPAARGWDARAGVKSDGN
jgi:hypothetical protein